MTAEAPPPDAMPHSGGTTARGLWPKRLRWRFSLALLLIIALTFTIAWFQRERIAVNLIDGTLKSYDLQASYEVETISAHQQVIRNLVIGDPAAPDLTAEEVRIDIVYSLGAPTVGRVHLVKPRLFAALRDGVFTLGSLDPLVFTESDEPAALPAIDLSIRDGRALIESDYGRIGVKLEGEGRLDDGFEGTLAAIAANVGIEGCTAQSATLYGTLATASGAPSFTGPVRLREVECEGARAASADVQANLSMPRDLASLKGRLGLDAGQSKYAGVALESATGTIDLGWRFAASGKGALSIDHDVTLGGMQAQGLEIAELALKGALRGDDTFTQGNWEMDFSGSGANVEAGQRAILTTLRTRAAGTLVESLAARLEQGIGRSLSGASLGGATNLRWNQDGINAVVPEARLRSASGETVLALSRASYSSRAKRFAGNFRTGGRDLPEISGRMEQLAGGDLALRMTMAEYRVGDDRLAMPRLDIRQDNSGNIAFEGVVTASGAIPGGSVRAATIPLDGMWSARAGLSLWSDCTGFSVASAQVGGALLDGRTFEVCPLESNAILTYRDELQIAAQADGLAFAGMLDGAPVSVAVERAKGSYPGHFGFYGTSVALGEGRDAYRLIADTLEGEFDPQVSDDLGGTLSGVTAILPAVPLNLQDAAANWRLDAGGFRLEGGSFALSDRYDPEVYSEPRFHPLIGQGMRLDLVDGVISARSELVHPESRSRLADVELTHALESATGGARITVDDLRFSDRLQPADLTEYARGVVAAAEGSVTGEGRIDWTADDISSSGVFRTDDFDFAAAFGPVSGVKGEIVFTDLINLTTAPSQVLEIASVNPGVEALAGRVVYSITNGVVIGIEDARWPFMGGELILRPTEVTFGGKNGQNYIFELIALDAATFVTQMELTNLGATGQFDGTIPIYFDQNGNGFIRGGLLIARPPGGNVAYVGELTYEDLGAMGNFAFQTLRSLDYRQMSVELEGSLAGEIVTRFNIDGVRQGEGSSQNFVTRRIAKLPIRFAINVRSDNFYLLATIVRGLFDPRVFDRDDVRQKLGIFGAPIAPSEPETLQSTDDIQRRDEPAVQPPESEDLP